MKAIYTIIFLLSITSLSNAQCILACNSSMNVSLDANMQGLLTPEILTEGDISACNLQVALYALDNETEVIPFADTLMVNCDHLGDFIFRVLDTNSGNQCFGTLSTFDQLGACITNTIDLSGTVIDDLGDRFNIQMDNYENTSLMIFNILGHRVMHQTINNQNTLIYKSDIGQKGPYIISIKQGKAVFSKKIMVF